MTDENRWLKKIRPKTVRYITDSSGKKVGIESFDSKLTITPGNSSQMDMCPWSNIVGKPELFPTTWHMIQDRPALFSGSYSDLANKPVLFSGKYSDLSGAPNVSTAAQSGSYNDLLDKPSLFSGAYADLLDLPDLFDGKWSSISGKPATFPTTWAQVADKPALFSGSYADLTNKPSLFDGSWNSLIDKPASYPTTWMQVADKPVLFSGNYNDLSNKPSLFNGSWTAITGKPSVFPSSWELVSNKPTLFSGSYNDLTDKPTDIVTPAALSTALADKANLNQLRRIDTYSGKTDANGLYTVTYPTPFPAIPSVQPEPPALPSQVWVKVSSTTTGFSLRLLQRNTVNLLNIEVLLGATVNVANADARVVVIAQ